MKNLSKLYTSIPALFLLVSEAMAQGAAAAPAVKRTNPVAEAFANAGVIGWCIVGVSILSLALIIENFMTLKRDKIAPPDLIDELEALFDEKNFQEALELCENERNYLTNVVAAGLNKLSHSFETIRAAVREMQDEESVKLFQKIGYLSLIAATAPMMGLLGTVSGMFITFGDIAAAGGSVSPAQLAGGIKLALTTTIFGLVVAIPVGAFFFMFRNRVVRTTIEVNAIAEDLFERFRPSK